MATVGVSGAFRKVRIDPDNVLRFGDVMDNRVVYQFRLTCRWQGSPGFWGGLGTGSGARTLQPEQVEFDTLKCLAVLAETAPLYLSVLHFVGYRGS